jgi:predicted TIM-barrel fold metal-dependent hydrolase
VIVDSLTFVGDSLLGPATTASELVARMEEEGIDVAVVCPVKPRGYHLGPANDAVAEAVRDHPGRLVGFARVDPSLGDAAAAELDRCVRELALRGLFLHPWEETFRVNGPAVDAVLERARAHGLPVIVAAGYPWLSEGLQVGDLAGRHGATPIVATNGCQLNISGLGQTDAELALEANPNLLIQTTGVYREDFLEGAVARFGAGRVLFASGWPRFDPRLELLRVRWAPNLDDGARELILGGNAARLLGLC